MRAQQNTLTLPFLAQKNSIELKKVCLFWHNFNYCTAEAFQRQRQQAGGVRIGNATSYLSCATRCACAYMFVCDLVFWLHREPIGLQSGRRACAVGWTLGFRQANSKQEIRKSAEQRDNDMEIRDQLTPTSGWLSCLLTDYDFLLDTSMQSMKHTLSNTTCCITHQPIQTNLSHPFTLSNTFSSWMCAIVSPTLWSFSISQEFNQQLHIGAHRLTGNGCSQPTGWTYFNTWLKWVPTQQRRWYHLLAGNYSKVGGQQI